MNTVKCLIVCTLLFLAPFSNGVTAPTNPLSKINRLPPSLEQIVQKVTGKLMERGYEVKRGYWALWGGDQCKYTISVLGRCYGPNPTAPYVVPFVPSWRDEFVDHSLHKVFGPERRGYAPIYRLDEREALVILAVLPPPGAYLGLQTSVFTREDKVNQNDPIYRHVPEELRDLLFATAPNPARLIVWSTIGNSNNHVVIEQQTGEKWEKNQQRFFIITPDQATEGDVALALKKAGVDANQIFVEPVAADVVKLGLDAAADDFQTILRYVQVPDDDGKAWRKRLPLTVLRVRYKDTSRPPEPYPVPTYDKKIATSELYLKKPDLENLISAVKQQWKQPNADESPFVVAELMWPKGLDTIGQHCLARPMNCLGDNQDDSFRISPTISLDPGAVIPDGVVQGDVVAVVGTLATATNNATYVSLAINSFPLVVSFDNLTNRNLAGSASKFSKSANNTDKFYVYYLSRDCAGLGSYCREIPESVVPFGGYIKLTERNYVQPESKTGRAPDATQMLTPSVIILKR